MFKQSVSFSSSSSSSRLPPPKPASTLLVDLISGSCPPSHPDVEPGSAANDGEDEQQFTERQTVGLGLLIDAVGGDDNRLGLVEFKLIDCSAGGDAGWCVWNGGFGFYRHEKGSTGESANALISLDRDRAR